MLPLQEGIVYGPVHSRRLGRSLGINVFPRSVKLCTFNCSYCQYGWTRATPRSPRAPAEVWPSPASIARAVALGLKRATAQRDHLSRLTLAGNGEPTLHPQFPEVVDQLRAVRNELAPSVPLAILSNSSTLGTPSVVKALAKLDERYMKLDAGEPALMRRINATTVPFEQIVDGLGRLQDIVIQTMFVRDRLGRIDNTGDVSVATWINVLLRLRPRAVQVYTIDREPAWPYLQPVPAARLDEIARRGRAAGLDVQMFASTPMAAAATGGR